MKTTILPTIRAYYDAERPGSVPKGGYIYPPERQREIENAVANLERNRNKPNNIPASKIDPRTMDAIKSGGDVTVEKKIDGTIHISKGMLSHDTTIGFNGAVLPNGEAIVLDTDVKVTYSQPIDTIVRPNSTIEGHEFTVTDKSGAMILGTIRIERIKRTDGTVSK